jgi:hypothetical protein
MTIDELTDLSREAFNVATKSGVDAFNRLEDEIAGYSYGRINELLRYLPDWADMNSTQFKTYSPLVAILESAKASIEDDDAYEMSILESKGLMP